MSDRRIIENARTFTRLLAFVIRFFHKFFKTRFFQSGNLDYGNAEPVFEFFFVDFVAVFFYGVHHVESHDHRNVDFEKLRSEIKVTLKVCSVNDIYYAIGFFVENVVPRDYFFWRIRRKRIYAGKVYNRDRFGALFIYAVTLIHRNAGPVTDVSGRARQTVE